MHHHQDCCERVTIESVDFSGGTDLSGAIVYEASEVTGKPQADYKFDYNYQPESYTWTFYKMKTSVGYVDIRWLGTSNGYYGERVDFQRIR
jgi:hypothetical protein